MKEVGKYFVVNVKKVTEDLKSKDKEIRKRQIPNLLTLIRGILAPITIIPSVLTGHIYIAFILIALCAFTDSFDGWYARKHNVQSEFGALLDAICDKIFVLTLAFPLIFIHTKMITIIIILEMVIASINVYSKLKGNKPKTSIIGKIKTIILDIFIALCYLDLIIRVPRFILYIASGLTNVMQVLSAERYYKEYKIQIADKNKLREAT